MSGDKEDVELSNVVDIRSRLPKPADATPPAERLAYAIFKIFMAEDVPTYEYFAALMIASHTIQRLLREGYEMSDDHIRALFSRAMDIAEKVKFTIDSGSSGPGKDAG